jgi:hypothetical protein
MNAADLQRVPTPAKAWLRRLAIGCVTRSILRILHNNLWPQRIATQTRIQQRYCVDLYTLFLLTLSLRNGFADEAIE